MSSDAGLCVKSQDVHTPRVIASDFVADDARGFIQPPFERRPGPRTPWSKPSVQSMDEVDGRPGPVALQFGHLDAPMDVPMVSLCLPLPFDCPPHELPETSTYFPPSAHYIQKEKPNENLPGK